ncbi:MAG TPA: hypothetical protein VGB26_10840 [Nitrospiria bacterium]|jgi:hypothetical protein
METQVKEGELFKDRNEKEKHPRVIRIKRVEKMGPLTYVFFMAENQAAQAIHPNGGFIPLDSFFKLWAPYQPQTPKK